MAGSSVIHRVDCGNEAFARAWKRLSHDVRKEAERALGQLLLLDVEDPPARLHLHPLTSKSVASHLDSSKKVKVYTFHITSNDSYKASFTLEGGTAYMRSCGPHDAVDKNP